MRQHHPASSLAGLSSTFCCFSYSVWKFSFMGEGKISAVWKHHTVKHIHKGDENHIGLNASYSTLEN